MRIASLALTLALAGAVDLPAQAPPPAPRPGAPAPAAATPIRPVGTMSELMVHVIKPTSDAVFYITSRTPATSEDWATLQSQTLMLAESANLLLLPAHARNRAQWNADTRLMLAAGKKAFEAAKARDVKALEALNDELYESCVTCHQHFRPGYGQRPGR